MDVLRCGFLHYGTAALRIKLVLRTETSVSSTIKGATFRNGYFSNHVSNKHTTPINALFYI